MYKSTSVLEYGVTIHHRRWPWCTIVQSFFYYSIESLLLRLASTGNLQVVTPLPPHPSTVAMATSLSTWGVWVGQPWTALRARDPSSCREWVSKWPLIVVLWWWRRPPGADRPFYEVATLTQQVVKGPGLTPWATANCILLATRRLPYWVVWGQGRVGMESQSEGSRGRGSRGEREERGRKIGRVLGRDWESVWNGEGERPEETLEAEGKGEILRMGGILRNR